MGILAVDLDRTLAFYSHWEGVDRIGEPIPEVVERVKEQLALGRKVVIFTARACHGPVAIRYIEDWCLRHLGRVLPVTNVKTYEIDEIWDDIAVKVVPNQGHFAKVCPTPSLCRKQCM